MAGRSKELGKLVSELTAEELKHEQQRCKDMLAAYGNRIASKSLRKRLHEITKRIEREAPGVSETGSD
jgi:hypothetical protein